MADRRRHNRANTQTSYADGGSEFGERDRQLRVTDDDQETAEESRRNLRANRRELNRRFKRDPYSD